MKVRLYIDDEIAKLKQSVFVRNVKYKRELEYEPLFKLWTIMMKHDFPELSAREIFAREANVSRIIFSLIPWAERSLRSFWNSIMTSFRQPYSVPR